VLAWHSVGIEQMELTAAQNNFQEALASVPSPTPLVRRDSAGRVLRRPPTTAPSGPRATQLHVLAYHANGHRLVRADVPLWFFKLKGPVVTYALRGTGFDLETLGLTASDLEQQGSAIVLDETQPGGSRVLAWTT
jgi:hypothetical protein